MRALGASRKTIETRHDRYVRRLDRLGEHTPNRLSHVEDGIGSRSAYLDLVRFFDEDIDQNSTTVTLEKYLPQLISGWVRHAFHGTIRLAYGIRFNVKSEIAAGLAYLASAGPDEQLAAIGKNAKTTDQFAWPPAIDISSNRFNARYAEVMRASTFAVHTNVMEENVSHIAADVLSIFNHTQDFFALHMVTGTHALVVCADAIKLNVDGLLNAGLAAAYQAIESPLFVRDAAPRPIRMDFAHEVKLAFSCLDQAQRFRNGSYQAAFDIYKPPLA